MFARVRLGARSLEVCLCANAKKADSLLGFVRPRKHAMCKKVHRPYEQLHKSHVVDKNDLVGSGCEQQRRSEAQLHYLGEVGEVDQRAVAL